MTGAPGGMFTAFGGVLDLLLVGTRNGGVNNSLHALNLADGTLLAEALRRRAGSRPDRADQRHAHDRQRDAAGLLRLARPPAATRFLPRGQRPASPRVHAQVVAEPRQHHGKPGAARRARVRRYRRAQARSTRSTRERPRRPHVRYVGRAGERIPVPRPPQRRPDVRDRPKVWSVSDDAAGDDRNWTWTIAGLNPSVILYWPHDEPRLRRQHCSGSSTSSTSRARRRRAADVKVQVLGDGLGQVGAPSLDIGVTPRLLVVGSEPGVVYGVEVAVPREDASAASSPRGSRLHSSQPGRAYRMEEGNGAAPPMAAAPGRTAALREAVGRLGATSRSSAQPDERLPEDAGGGVDCTAVGPVSS